MKKLYMVNNNFFRFLSNLIKISDLIIVMFNFFAPDLLDPFPKMVIFGIKDKV